MRSSRTRWRLWLMALLVGALSLFSTGAAEAAWTVSGSGSGTGRGLVLQPPTSVAVTQACVADPVPVRRSGAGGFSFTSGTSSGSLTIAKPSGAVAGDVLLAGITWDGNHLTYRPSAPAGWTLVQDNGDNTIGQFVYYRVVTASEPTSHTWTGQSTNSAGGIAAFSGVDLTAPVNVQGGQVNQTSGEITAPSITTTRANVLLVGIFGVLQQTTPTAPTGMSAIWTGSSSGTGGPTFQVSSLAAAQAWPTPGATGTRTATTSAGSRTIGQMIALQPPLKPHATSTWTASSSTYATGQVFRRSTGATVQREATLSPSVTSQTDGPLASGSPYSVDVTTTYSNWTSSTTAASFTARSC